MKDSIMRLFTLAGDYKQKMFFSVFLATLSVAPVSIIRFLRYCSNNAGSICGRPIKNRVRRARF